MNIWEKYGIKRVEQNIDIKEKFVQLIFDLTVYLDETKCCFSGKYDINDPDYPILKEKMENLIKKLDNMSPSEKKKFIKLDIETQIWSMI